MMKNTQIEKAKKVFDSVSQNVSVKIILNMKGNYIGKLITKYTKSSAHTILFLGDFVGYEKCSGYGYNMEENNFRNIVIKNKSEIENTGDGYIIFDFMNDFNKFIEKNGYKVITAI